MKKHVLIVEDEATLAGMMSHVLRKKNIRVSVACDGRKALDILEKDAPDVLILDILLPILDGHSVLRTMKEKNIRCFVIVISNLHDSLTKMQCKELDVDEYFVKSDMDDDALWETLAKHLQ